MTDASGIAARPSATARSFSSRSLVRTAPMPCSASSAIGRCSGGNSASTAVRCALPGRRRFGLGRCGTSGGGVNDGPRRSRGGRPPSRPPSGPAVPAARPATITRALRAGDRSFDDRDRDRRGDRDPACRRAPAVAAVRRRVAAGGRRRSGAAARRARDRRGSRSPAGTRARRAAASAARGRASRDRRRPTSTLMPSSSCSTSTLSSSPTLAPLGRIAPSSVPRGWRAPAARHVQVPSSSALVSSMSIRRDMVCNRIA